MKIQKVTNKNEEKLFINMVFDIYKNDENWIPHLKQDIERIFNPQKNKTFQFGKAQRWILFDKNKKVIGRIAAFINEKTAFSTKYATGGMGYFECINSQEAANLLFETGITWLKENKMEAVDAPINFGERNEFWGLLIKNFSSPPTYLMSYNPKYYKDLFENFGFNVYYEQFLFQRKLAEQVQDVFIEKSKEILKDKNFKCTNAKNLNYKQIAEYFLQVYNNAWTAHEGFKAINFEKAMKIIQSMKNAIDKEIFIFAFYNENPVGFFMNLPELNQIFKYFNGNLNWINKIKFLYHKWRKTANTMYGLAFGIVKEFQGKGVEGAMIIFAEDNIVSKNIYKDIIMTWIGDFNPKMLKVVQNLGAKKYRTLATYRKNFNENADFERYPIINITKNL